MKKKFCGFVVIVMLLLLEMCPAFATVYGRGGYEREGYSEATAWEIDSAAVLAKFRDDVNAGKLQHAFYVKLTKDIDLTAYRAWEPIGRNPFAADLNFNPNDARGCFRGHFDGNGHTINVDFSILCAKSSYYDIVPIFHGLFGIVMGGSIKNLNVSGNIEVFMRESSTPVLVGGIASYLASGSIENCKFNGNIKAENLVGSFRSDGGTQAGGIVARAGYSFYIFSIKNCRVGSCSDTVITASDALASGNTYAGGIAAYLDDNTYQSKSSTVSGNYIRAEINARYSGGVCGKRGRGTGIVRDNTEDDPSDPPPDTASITITTESLPSGKINENYSETLKAELTGAELPASWSVSSGTLPSGLTLNADGTITGNPTKAGTYTFTVAAVFGAFTGSKSFTVTIAKGASAIAPKITTAAKLPGGVLKKAYSQTLSATGTASITWTKTGGTLPAGLTLSKTGKISGTPTKAGTFKFTVKASNTAGNNSRVFTIAITQPKISAVFANSTVKAKYTSTITVSGGSAPYTWKKSGGTLPTGLKLTYSGAKATLSGTPTKAGTFTFKLTATDKNKAAVTKSFTVKITQPTFSGTFTANGAVKKSYSSSVTVSDGTTPYTWAKTSGTLPTGLKLTYSGTKAKLSGTPTKAGTFKFTLKVTDKNKAAVTKSFTVKITQPTFSGTFTANGAVKKSYSSTVTVSGDTTPYTWKKSSGTLPTGLKLTYSGTKAKLSGTPTKAGTYKFTLKVTDKNKAAVSKTFTVKIAAAKSSNDTKSDNKSSPEPETKTEQKQDTKSSPEDKSTLPEALPDLPATGENVVTLSADLKVVSDDIVESYDGRDSDLVKVHADKSLSFTVSNWRAEISSAVVYIDDKPLNGITVSDEGLFILPAEIVSGDFKVGVKAQSEAGELESSELYIIAE